MGRSGGPVSPEVKVTREQTDPLCMRASIGGTPEIGYYLVWRGDDPQAVVTMLRATLSVAERELPKQVRPRG